MKYLPAILLLIIFGCNRQPKYHVLIFAEKVNPMVLSIQMPVEKSIRAKNEDDALLKAIDLMLKMESENKDSTFVFSDLALFDENKNTVRVEDFNKKYWIDKRGGRFLERRIREKSSVLYENHPMFKNIRETLDKNY